MPQAPTPPAPPAPPAPPQAAAPPAAPAPPVPQQAAAPAVPAAPAIPEAPAAQGEDKPRAGRPSKPDFTGGTRNAESRLTAIPTDWNSGFKALITTGKSSDFASEALGLEWDAIQFEAKAKDYTQRAADARSLAAQAAQFGGTDTLAQIRKAQKMTAQLAELNATLTGLGVDPSTVAGLSL